MARKKWTRPVAENVASGITETMKKANEDLKELDKIVDEIEEIVKEENVESVKRNKIFDFAGELSMKVCPDVKVMVLNHDVKSIIFTATFEGLSQADIDGVIEASK